MQANLIISLYPGIGLLERPFLAAGFCVLRGPDMIWGQSMNNFHLPPGIAWGIIAGPPCQDFSGARRAPPTGEGQRQLDTLARVITRANPAWWLIENVPRVPDVHVAGYQWQRLYIDAASYTNVSRPRIIQYGYRTGRPLDIPATPKNHPLHPAVTTNDPRSLREITALQGLPPNFTLPDLTVTAAKRAIGNGVPYCIASALTLALIQAHDLAIQPPPPQQTPDAPFRLCPCHCGAIVQGARTYATPACRKRAQRRRNRNP